MTALRIGVDIGGTFTDFTVLGEDGSILLWKEDSTPEAPVRAIESGLAAVAAELGEDVATLLRRTALLVHGTTIATNILIQRSGPPIGLLCTEGFRDVLYFRDGYKRERFNIRLPHPDPLVPRYLRLGVPGRIGPRGEELVPLDEAAVRAAAATFRAEGVEAVAVAFLWSVANEAHEVRACELLAEELPGVAVRRSSAVLPEIREWERTSATALSAYVLPAIGDYLRRLERSLGGAGLARAPLVMQINGGCASIEEILAAPVNVLASGPAAAPAAALAHAAALGGRDLICIDMGGTSFDVCLIQDGRAAVSRDIRVDEQPVGVPGVEVTSVGAGGGSIAWVDAGGALRVGPRSAGARPGPAAYGQGGEEPTVTDANVVLGVLDPDAFLGGRRALHVELAAAAIERHVARPLGLDVVGAAAGIVRIVESNMVAAIRAVSLERGIDPRRFTLVSGGGAGGVHATRIARALGIARVVVPREAGTLCAFGMAVTDVRHDHARALHAQTDALDVARVRALYAELDAEARERLRASGFADDAIRLERAVDARYPGQVHELTVPVPAECGDDLAAQIEAAFHAEHRRRFTYDRTELPVELLHWRVAASGSTGRAAARAGQSAAASSASWQPTRRVVLDGELREVAVHDATALPAGVSVAGPAVLQAPTTTVLLQPGDGLRVLDDGTFLIDVGA
jgi:N-methylhydantoinase A